MEPEDEIIIDEEFKALMPALDVETCAALERNLIENGCMYPLVLWNGILIDGHNRYELCTKNNIPYKTINKDFPSRDAALIWIIANQIARRNLTPLQLSNFRGLHYRAVKRIFANKQGKNQYSEDVGHNDPHPTTAKQLAGQYNVSQKTIKRDAGVSAALEAIGEVSLLAKEKVMSGGVPLNKKELRDLSRKSKDEIEALAKQIEEGSYDKGTYKKDMPETQTAESGGNANKSAAEIIHSFHDLVRKTTNDFTGKLKRLSVSENAIEYRAMLRSYIDALEEMYGQLE